MYQSTASSRERLLIDIECGRVLQSPPECRPSVRYIDSHPFAHVVNGYVLVGPDAERVAGGAGGEDYLTYRIEGQELGVYYLVREV